MSDYFRETQDPDEVLDYSFAWELDAGETISNQNSTWTVTPANELTINSSEVNTQDATIGNKTFVAGTVTTVWLTGGTPGKTYRVTNRVTTSANRTFERSFIVDIQEK